MRPGPRANLIGPFLPKLTRRTDGRERPWRENRAVLNGILWILRTGAPWACLPARYPSHQTCHRRFQQWVRAGVLRSILEWGSGEQALSRAHRPTYIRRVLEQIPIPQIQREAREQAVVLQFSVKGAISG